MMQSNAAFDHLVLFEKSDAAFFHFVFAKDCIESMAECPFSGVEGVHHEKA